MSRNTRPVERVAAPVWPTTGVRGGPVPWRALLVRLFVVVGPAQVLGLLIAGQVLTLSGLLTQHPGAGTAVALGSGLLGGLAVGVLLTPVPGRTRAYAVACAVFGVLSYLVLGGLAALRLPGDGPGLNLLAGALGVAAIQTAVAVGLWSFRHRLR